MTDTGKFVDWSLGVHSTLSVKLFEAVEKIEGELADDEGKAADDDYNFPGVFKIAFFDKAHFPILANVFLPTFRI